MNFKVLLTRQSPRTPNRTPNSRETHSRKKAVSDTKEQTQQCCQRTEGAGRNGAVLSERRRENNI